MYRQASMMRRIDLTVMTNRYDNRERFPAEGFDVSVVQGRQRLPRSPRIREWCLAWQARRNRLVSRLAMSHAETRWWQSQIANRRPDAVLAHFGTTAVEVCPLFRQAGIPLVAHFNGFDLSRSLRSSRYRRLLRESVSSIHTYVVVADYMRDALLQLGIPEERIEKIPYGTPIPPMDPVVDQCESPCRFLTIGRFVEKKRPDLTIAAFAEVASTDPSCRLVMVGDGPLLDRCKRLVKSLEIEDRVEFLGSLSPERVQAELASASVFVQHSSTSSDGDKEGWPVAVAEAAARSLPVVATRHASIPEQVPHGECGLLCEEGDWQEMARHLVRLARDPDERTEMGKAARSRMESIRVERQVVKLEDVLRSAADSVTG